jgi:hypothetical protein
MKMSHVTSYILMSLLCLTVLPQPLFSLVHHPRSPTYTGIKRDNQFANTLEDTIIQREAPNRLLIDRGQAIVSHKVEDIILHQ